MKTLLRILVALSLTACVGRSAENFVVVPARGLSPQNAKTILAEVVTAATERLPSGAQIRVVDPVTLDLIASLTVPEGTKAQRERSVPFAKQVAPLRTALLGLPVNRPWENAALRIPEILRFLAEQVVPRGEKATVLFVGSPLYRSSSGTFDFANGVVPSDGWLSAPAEDSPFATSGISCKGWSIHLAVTQPVWADSEWQTKEVQRFWCAFVHATGGNVVTLAPLNVAWERIRKGATDPLTFRPIDPSDRSTVWRKRIFIRGEETESTLKSNDMTEVVEPIAPPVAPAVPANAVVAVNPPPPPAPTLVSPPIVVVETVVAPVEPVKAAPSMLSSLQVKATALPSVAPGRLGIGLVWETDSRYSSGCDLDLWVKVAGEAECNYKRMRIPNSAQPRVRLYEDIRKAKGIASGSEQPVFEFCEVSRARPADVELWINMFQNSGKRPVRALVQLEYQGTKYTQVIEFPAMSGNRADNAGNRSNSPRWIRLDLAKIAQAPAAP